MQLDPCSMQEIAYGPHDVIDVTFVQRSQYFRLASLERAGRLSGKQISQRTVVRIGIKNCFEDQKLLIGKALLLNDRLRFLDEHKESHGLCFPIKHNRAIQQFKELIGDKAVILDRL
jgi:hypothetical protein